MGKLENKMKDVLIMSPYRTGSTVVYQIIKLLNLNPLKTHDPPDINNGIFFFKRSK